MLYLPHPHKLCSFYKILYPVLPKVPYISLSAKIKTTATYAGRIRLPYIYTVKLADTPLRRAPHHNGQLTVVHKYFFTLCN